MAVSLAGLAGGRFKPRLPLATESLLIQVLSLLLAAALVARLGLGGLWMVVGVQGVMAAALSFVLRQPVWWYGLHLGFLPAAWWVHQAQVAPETWLILFAVLASVYWSCFRTRVPLYLSSRRAWRAVEAQLVACGARRMVDLGSGLGGLSLYLARRHPDWHCVGVEIAPLPWLVSRTRALIRRNPAVFVRQDYTRLDLSQFDAVFAFLSPAAMPGLWAQAREQMKPGSTLLSLSFVVEHQPPHETVVLAKGARHRLHVWRL